MIRTDKGKNKAVYEREARAWRLGQRFSTSYTQVHKNHFTAYGHRVIEQVDGMLYARVPELDKRQTRSLLKHLEAILQIQLKEEDGRYYKTEAGRQVELWPGFWYNVSDYRPLPLLATITAIRVAGVTPAKFKKGKFRRYVFIDRSCWRQYDRLIQEHTFSVGYSLSRFQATSLWTLLYRLRELIEKICLVATKEEPLALVGMNGYCTTD